MGMFDDLIPQQQNAGGMFDDLIPKEPARPLDQQPPQELTFAEKYIAPVLDKLGTAIQSDPGLTGTIARGVLNDGNARGAPVGRLAQGAADVGSAGVQLAANVLPNSTGIPQAVNKGIADEEKKYQAARAQAGSEGWDPLRDVGRAGISMLIPGMGTSNAEATLLQMMGRGAAQGGASGALTPVTDGGDNFWKEKGMQTGAGALTGGILSPALGAAARVVSPKASVNPKLQMLREEGVTPSVGQALGGAANTVEEQLQSWPLVGSLVQSARQRGGDQLERAAFARVGDPIGKTINDVGNAGIAEAADKLGQAYESALPKLSVNVLDGDFVQRMSSLRGLVQNLPEDERNQFDGVISREIDQRLSPNGTLSGQNLKDAWNALRDAGKQFSNSNDAYQAKLGQAFKQAFQELKGTVSAQNAPEDVAALKAADLGYANFKILQRAAASVGADEGSFTPAQLFSAVKAMDTSKDKARFAGGTALMQDLAGAGKSVLTNKVPDSGSAGRGLLAALVAGVAGGGLGAGAVLAPHLTLGGVAAGAGVGAAYSQPGQNLLRYLVMRRPQAAPAVANYLRQLAGPATLAAAPLAAQGQR